MEPQTSEVELHLDAELEDDANLDVALECRPSSASIGDISRTESAEATRAIVIVAGAVFIGAVSEVEGW